MDELTPAIARLVGHFRRLPGVGQKTAQRYAYAILSMDKEEVAAFGADLIEAKTKTGFCSVCGNFSEEDVCPICARRSAEALCVVAHAKDILTMERINDYHGVYHVLGGVISPLKGITPDDLRVKELLKRLSEGKTKEVIMATNPDVEGDATAYYLARLIKPLGIKVTRLAQGISIGSDLEYADEVTLSRAISNRSEM